jgi:hypothetical protein
MKGACFWVLVFLAVCPRSAWAYLDPGVGSAFLQGILAAIVAAGVVLKMYWHKLLAVVRKLFKRNDSSKTAPRLDRDGE